MQCFSNNRIKSSGWFVMETFHSGFELLAPLISSSSKGGSAGGGTSLKKSPKCSLSQHAAVGVTPFAHAELIWVLSLCKYSTNCPRPSETIYSYHKAWEPSVPNGVICIVNGDALLVCSIWLCTGALMGARWTVSVLPCPHAAVWRPSAGPRLPLVAPSGAARSGTKPKTSRSQDCFSLSAQMRRVAFVEQITPHSP